MEVPLTLGCLSSVSFTATNAPDAKVPPEKAIFKGVYSAVPVVSPTGKTNEEADVKYFRRVPVPVATIILATPGVPNTLVVAPSVKS